MDIAKLTAWFAADAVANQFAKDPKRSMDALWPAPKPKIKSDPKQTAKICKAHGLNLLEDPNA